MRRPRPDIPRHCILMLLALGLAILPFAARAGDAVLDAKRTAAAKLVKDGKSADAQKLYEEIIAQDGSVWSDHYALAKIYDKAGDTDRAAGAYREVAALLRDAAKSSAERTALSDSEKRLKVLDSSMERFETAVKQFYKELDDIAADARKNKNAKLLEKIEALRKNLAPLTGEPTILEIPAKAGWVDTHIDVAKGDRVRVVAKGTWSVLVGNPAMTSDANGTPDKDPETGLPWGMLVARVGPKGAIIGIGTSGGIAASEAGRLYLAAHDPYPSNNSGSMEVSVSVR